MQSLDNPLNEYNWFNVNNGSRLGEVVEVEDGYDVVDWDSA